MFKMMKTTTSLNNYYYHILNTCSNYSEIVMNGSMSRIYDEILKHRIEKEYQLMEEDENGGFRVEHLQ